MKSQPSEVIVDIPLSGVTRVYISEQVALNQPIPIRYKPLSEDYAQNLDSPSYMVIAALAVGCINMVVGLINMFINLERRNDAQTWTVEKATSVVREKAAAFLGTAAVSQLRFEGYDEFVERNSDVFKVIGEVGDEEYSFHVCRDGAVFILRLQI